MFKSGQTVQWLEQTNLCSDFSGSFVNTMKADDVYQASARADQNYRYWSCIVERLYRRRKYSDFIIAVCSSSVPITAGLIQKHSFIWQWLSCIAAFGSIWAASFNLKEELKAATELKGCWYQLYIEYEALWDEVEAIEGDLAKETKSMFQKLRKRQADLEPLEPGITFDGKLADRCRDEVCRNRGIEIAPTEKPSTTDLTNAETRKETTR
jgi:hypothetical protein